MKTYKNTITATKESQSIDLTEERLPIICAKYHKCGYHTYD